MSVLACDRNGCENIMCDRYSHRYGYICDDCFKELVRMGPTIEIEDFMRSYKNNSDTVDEAYARYNVVFSLMD